MKKDPQWTGERLVTTVLNEIAVEHLSRYAFSQAFVTGKKVLDLACGEGYGSFLLAKHAAEVMGVDIDKKIIEHAQNKYRKNNLSYECSSATNLSYTDSAFDTVVSFETIEHVSDQQSVLAEIKRVLKKDGFLIISTPNKEMSMQANEQTNKFHLKELMMEEFVALLKMKFSNVVLLQQQNLYGSLIYGSHTNINKINQFSGSFNTLKEEDKLTNAPYFIALASDEDLPQIQGSFFHAANIYEAQAALLKATASYRLGHLLLSPLKWLKAILRK